MKCQSPSVNWKVFLLKWFIFVKRIFLIDYPISILLAIPHCFDSCSFLNLTLSNIIPSTLFFLFIWWREFFWFYCSVYLQSTTWWDISYKYTKSVWESWETLIFSLTSVFQSINTLYLFDLLNSFLTLYIHILFA